jgi:hypothetical protein
MQSRQAETARRRLDFGSSPLWPVKFPSGRAKLATNPDPSGSCFFSAPTYATSSADLELRHQRCPQDDSLQSFMSIGLKDCSRCKTDIPNTAAELRHRASPDKEGRR